MDGQIEDISLLFSSLVILPQDKEAVSEEKSETAQVEVSQTLVEEKEPLVESTTKETPAKDAPAVEEPAPVYKKETHPFTLFLPAALRETYLADQSKFLKILDALAIPQLKKYIQTDLSEENVTSFDCVWCIGLDIKSEKDLRALNHKNILFSPDIEQLKTVEEKKEMYAPLKMFVNSNEQLFSHI